MSVKQAAEQHGRDVRSNSPAPRPNTADVPAQTAANLYALMAWLYDKPKN